MRYLLVAFSCIALLVYYTPPAVPPLAGLTVAALSENMPLPGKIHSEGEGNFHRRLTGQSVENQTVIELAAGASGKIAYIEESPAGPDIVGRFRVQFLSTQGTGQVVLEALGSDQKPVARLVWLITGAKPRLDGKFGILDKRSSVNYQGDWLEEAVNVSQLLRNLTKSSLQHAETYRLSIVAGEGQHVLISEAVFSSELSSRIRISPVTPARQASLGEQLTVAADIENISREKLPAFQAGVWNYAYGLVVEGPQEYTVDNLAPGEKVRLTWTVRAQRPDLVNQGRPWTLSYTVNGQIHGEATCVSVPDHRPGKVFYVMTEDLEPIDSAGYPRRWGNADGWLNPDEFLVQMIGKAEKLNTIAETYGAKWTHYIAWPAVRAAEWAAGQSGTGAWRQIAERMRQSVIEQSAKGHEYALHLHSDYDPDLSGNVLSYNPTTDGFWANHRRHGWAHSVLEEGNFAIYDSRVGILYAYQSILDRLTQDSGQGQILTARAGSFDFGDGEIDEAMSTRAYRQVGLWGSSDADGNRGGMTSAPYGREIYFARFDDINAPAESPLVNGLVQFRPTPAEPIVYDKDSATVMNEKSDHGMSVFIKQEKIKPGVHAIIGFSHAMFIMGEGDWRSLDGGQFIEVDRHLRYLQERYVNRDLLQFATATQLVAAYLDYFTPVPVAIYGPKLRQGIGEVEYAITILGKDIPISPSHPHQLTVKLPLYLRDSAFYAEILKNGEPIYSTWEPSANTCDIPFIANESSATYSLKVYYDERLFAIWRGLQEWWKVMQ